MHILSPYGKHVPTELKDVYDLSSVAELLARSPVFNELLRF
jgi:hypothetical protein